MKYEVIGWTYCGTHSYPKHKDITACVDDVIIKEIRKHGYLFGGDRHEDYCPVLNDGTYVSYSWRGWGRIMALAYGKDGDYSYMFGYMDSLMDRKKLKYPPYCEVDETRIVPKETLAETFVMHLSDDMFEKVKAGTKTVEIRLFDDKRKLVDIGDYIEFRKASGENERVKRRVVDLDIWESFEELFEKEEYVGNSKWVDKLRFTPEQIGSPANSTAAEMAEAMYKYYDKAQVEKYGVMAFILQKPEHYCKTQLRIGFDFDDGGDIYLQRLNDPDMSDEKFKKLESERSDEFLIENEFSQLSINYEKFWTYLICGENEKYNADINVMLRETLKDLFGKEEKLKALRYRFCLSLTLEVTVTVCKSSEEPEPDLTIAWDIDEFLKRADVEIKINKMKV